MQIAVCGTVFSIHSSNAYLISVTSYCMHQDFTAWDTNETHQSLAGQNKKTNGQEWPTGCSLPTPVLEPAWLFLPIWATAAYLLDQTLQASIHSPHSLVSLDNRVAGSSLLLLGPLLIYWPLQTDSTKKGRVWHTNVLHIGTKWASLSAALNIMNQLLSLCAFMDLMKDFKTLLHPFPDFHTSEHVKITHLHNLT